MNRDKITDKRFDGERAWPYLSEFGTHLNDFAHLEIFHVFSNYKIQIKNIFYSLTSRFYEKCAVFVLQFQNLQL